MESHSSSLSRRVHFEEATTDGERRGHTFVYTFLFFFRAEAYFEKSLLPLSARPPDKNFVSKAHSRIAAGQPFQRLRRATHRLTPHHFSPPLNVHLQVRRRDQRSTIFRCDIPMRLPSPRTTATARYCLNLKKKGFVSALLTQGNRYRWAHTRRSTV